MAGGEIVIVSRYNEDNVPPRGWDVPAEDELRELIRALRPDTLARFYSREGYFLRREPWGEISRSEDITPRNAFSVYFQRRPLIIPGIVTF